MRGTSSIPPTAERLGRGGFVRLAYRLGQSRATGILTVFATSGNAEVLVLRRGQLITRDADALGRQSRLRLERIAADSAALAHFDGGVSAYPPGTGSRPRSLAGWARSHLEAQVDSKRAASLVEELAGVRLVLIADRAPGPDLLDDTDRRILAAMREPRRIDQIWPLARTPRFRLLSFLHFLRSVGAVRQLGVAARPPVPERNDPHALRTLGVGPAADREAVKRAYRRLARALHPDLHPEVDASRRRDLERKLAEINSAYRRLVAD